MSMKFLPPAYNTKDLEKTTKNKWRWDWLTEKDKDGDKWGGLAKKAGYRRFSILRGVQ